MRHHKIMVDLEQRQLLPHARFMLTQRVDPTTDGSHMLPDGQTQTLYKRRVDPPAMRSQYRIDRLRRTKHHPRAHSHQS